MASPFWAPSQILPLIGLAFLMNNLGLEAAPFLVADSCSQLPATLHLVDFCDKQVSATSLGPASCLSDMVPSQAPPTETDLFITV